MELVVRGHKQLSPARVRLGSVAVAVAEVVVPGCEQHHGRSVRNGFPLLELP